MADRSQLPVLRRARSGDPVAQFTLGLLYLEGKGGLAADPAAAFMWLHKAALQGHRDALIAIGERIPAAVIADPAGAAPLFQRAADAGCARARKVLADWILAGLDVGVPAEQALELIEAAAREGDAGAQLRLAYCLEHGEGCVTAPDRALYWYEQAARRGSFAAQEALAEIYWRTGQRDAANWLTVCASRGSAAAAGRLGLSLLREGKMHEAAPWLEQAASAGERDAQLALGRLYATKGGQRLVGVAHNYKKAAGWMERAARQGSAEAWFALSQLYSLRASSLHDPLTARRHLERAAELGHVEAQYLCGAAYLRHGRGPNDDVIAAGWLTRAAAAGSREAAALLHEAWPAGPSASAGVLARRARALTAIARVDLALATRLELRDALRLHLIEALLIDPGNSDRGCCLVVSGSEKVGQSRRRLVLIEGPAQRSALDRAKRILANEDGRTTLRERKGHLARTLAALGINPALFEAPSR